MADLAQTLKKIRYLLMMVREKGLKFTLNFIHFKLFFGTKNPWLLWWLYTFKPYPSYIEIEVTTRCNLKCRMCEHTYWHEPNRDMSFAQFKSIVDQFPDLKWIGLTGIGESFLNKDFMSMLRYVKQKGVFVELYDPFYFINDNQALELIELGVDKIFISLDAATKEVYEANRVGSSFEKVTNNLRNFIRLKRQSKSYFPELAFHFIINKLNIREMNQYIELVHSLVGRGGRINFTRMLHSFPEIADLFVEVPQTVIEAAEKKGRELGIGIVWNEDVPEQKPPLKKCSEWCMPFIFVTGHVIPCCAGNEANQRDFQKKTALGNVFEKSFKDIWYSREYNNLRSSLGQNKVPAACVNCCLYNLKS
ncbi:radical SAM/SPASM domain-containing protein [Candidatus Margulisiibacteriota bacterium]